MLRGISSITALVVVSTLAGCSSAGPGQGSEQVGVQSQAATAQCRHGGTRTVSLMSFDTTSLELTGFAEDGSYVDVWLTRDTTPIAANIQIFPPDPIFPQCKDDATAWNGALGDGLTSTALADLGQLATDGCNVAVTLAFDGSVVSVQPVP
jgi:hypothetical protein